ncbi:MAG: SDR family NAD(P)-dependent oxidoreductase [Chloroflexota bacterium]
MNKPVCAIVGVGPGNGAAFAHKFSNEGYQVALLARNQQYLDDLANEIDASRAYSCDVTDIERIKNVFASIKSDMGPVDVLIYNAGSGVFTTVDDTSVEDFELSWRINTLGLLVASQQVLNDMRSRGGGTILVTGATASLRGNVSTAPFASAKAAQRSLAQSIAKHAGPDGIHVSYVILDGGVDSERARQFMPDRPEDGFLKPDEIADTYYYLAQQHQSTWTFELDLRPYVEKW